MQDTALDEAVKVEEGSEPPLDGAKMVRKAA